MGWSCGTNRVNNKYSILIAKILTADRLPGLGVREKYKLYISFNYLFHLMTVSVPEIT
jgi:hypothetical protein